MQLPWTTNRVLDEAKQFPAAATPLVANIYEEAVELVARLVALRHGLTFSLILSAEVRHAAVFCRRLEWLDPGTQWLPTSLVSLQARIIKIEASNQIVRRRPPKKAETE